MGPLVNESAVEEHFAAIEKAKEQGGKVLVIKVKERPVLTTVTYEDNSVATRTAIEDRLLTEVDRSPDARALVLDLEASTQLDTTSADVLTHLAGELHQREVLLYMARAHHRVEAVLENAGFTAYRNRPRGSEPSSL